jgi:hypothetical protein
MRLGDLGRRWWQALVVAAVVAALAGACGGSGDDGAGGAADDTVPEDGVEWEVVPEDPDDTDDPTQFAFGQEVRLVEGGIEPRLLAADIAAPIRITNTTGAPLEVRFTNPGWDMAGTTSTGPLAPGASFELEPIGVASITYEVVGTELAGTIQVEEGLDTL